MFARFLITLLISTCSTVLADDEDCLFDQYEQHAAYLELQKAHPGSRYMEDSPRLVIPRNGNILTLRRGGCVHFGISIELQTPRTDAYISEAAFFAKILEFVSEFGGQMVQADKLAENIKQQKWHNASDEDVMYYFIGYEGVEGVEVYQRHTQALTTIGASFYN